ncbi:hypothetical protein MWG07_00355 [Fusobacterium necrophorum]|uniref:Integrase n=1 Tax=Fusobacterium necrophorum TaxID=859 RepID=A0AAW6W7P0_9FUSO|nr:hypothetical protein [Fusobacterium necrophorum]MDK4479927.1 hypothetical protein [Fusobacterium necrophorum]MDK4510716.1 hypothetical protein [Fusobacterium necrophorum]
MEKKITEAQEKAIKNYRKKNPEKTRYYSYRSTMRTFINKYSTLEDLKEIEELIKKRKEEIE